MLLFIWWNSSLKHPLIILLLSKVGQQATTGKLFESILQLKLLFGKEVSTWDCNNPMAHISKKEGQEKKHRQGKKLRLLLQARALTVVIAEASIWRQQEEII